MPCPFTMVCGKKTTFDIKVFCVGAPHSGNDSLTPALEMLYQNPIYDIHRSMGCCQMARWKKLLDKKHGDGKPEDKVISKDDFDNMYRGHCAVNLSPHIFFLEDLVKAYPNAKFILTKVDESTWLKTVRESTMSLEFLKDQGLFVRIGRYLTGFGKRVEFRNNLIFKTYGDLDLLKDDDVLKFYRKHYETVAKHVPKDKCLEFNEKDGWAPLIKFLDMPEPVVEFPLCKNCQCPVAKIDKVVGNVIKYGLPLTIAVAIAVAVGVAVKKA